jgi:uncharacterized protein (TIGR02265 family)
MSEQIRGAILLSRKAFVIKHFGDAAWRQVVQSLSEEEQQLLDGLIIHVGWYPFEIGERLDKTIVQVLGRGDTQVFEKIGAQSAIENLNGVHKDFIREGDPQAFMRQANTIYSFYYDKGRRTYEPTGPTSGVMTTHEAETLSAVDCLTVIGWYRTALEMCGAKNVRIVEESCRAKGDLVCQYRFDWTI